MSTSDRAKAFISNKLKRTALIILPLAAAAVQCHASVSFSLGSGFLNASGSALTVVNSAFSGVPIPNGVNGIALAGGATFIASGSGTGAGGAAGCINLCAGFSADGSVSGSFDSDSLLVSYLFNLSASNSDSLDWFLFVFIGGETASANGTTASGGQVDDSFTFTGLNGLSLPAGWNVELEVNFHDDYNSGDSITVDVPAGTTVDIGAVSATPEPGTAGLLAIAGAALIGLRKRLLRR
jgi:hypothetical protein